MARWRVIPPRMIPPGARRFAGFAGPAARGSVPLPMPVGTPGNPVSPYDEREVWGGPAGDTVSAPLDPSSAIPGGPATGPASSDGLSVPFGQSLVDWSNPSTWQTVPLLASTPTNVPVLSLNLLRNGLLIQNGSAATSPDTAPILYVGFNAAPNIGFGIALAPATALNQVGQGIVFDIICPRDSVYVAFGPSSGGSVVIRGVVAQSTWIKRT